MKKKKNRVGVGLPCAPLLISHHHPIFIFCLIFCDLQFKFYMLANTFFELGNIASWFFCLVPKTSLIATLSVT